jgi:murein DD-endopeptidase MepM/ murein hydrolase activator NlpD
LGVLLVGLVGVNVYVFFFNRHTAPREVLNLQSTSKTMDATRREALAQDARAAHDLILAGDRPKDASRAGRPKKDAPGAAPAAREAPVAAAATDSEAASAPAPNPPTPSTPSLPVLAAKTATAPGAPNPVAAKTASDAPAPPIIRVPFAPPPEPVAARTAGPRPAIQVPFAPPPEDDAAEAPAGPEPVAHAFNPSDTLGQVLAREGFSAAGPAVIAALAKLTDPRTIRGGQKYVVHLGEDGSPAGFEYQPSPVLRYLVEKADDSDKWSGRKLESAVEVKTVEAGGVVESSLYESVQKSGEPTGLVGLLVELFAWDVNFYIDTHPGDHWKVVVEKQYLGGQFYKYGRLLAAEYGGKVGTFRAFFWAGKDAARDRPGKYYDEHGQALTKSMLKTPLRFVRISSKFDRKRFHPILHVEKAHLGIDYAAPVGTPVWASASGKVVEVGMKRGSGNTIVIAHSNGLNTRYYHLSRFARGLHAGQQVRQKDVIGFVGTTGLSTGPHLHFSVTKNGAFVDPSKLAVNRDPPVPDPGAFAAAIRPRIAALKAIQPGAVARN